MHHVCEIRRPRVVHLGLRAIAIAGVAVALSAFIQIQSLRRGKIRLRTFQRTLHSLGFFGHNPRSRMEKRIHSRARGNQEQNNEDRTS